MSDDGTHETGADPRRRLVDGDLTYGWGGERESPTMTTEDNCETAVTESDSSSIREVLGERSLVVASNREPYCHEYEDGEVTVDRPAGGLTAALDPVMQALGGTWVAWGSGEADWEVADEDGRVAVPPEDPSYDIARVALSEEQVENYYYGYSNQVLWPLCHGMPTRARFEDSFWPAYREVNDEFASAIAEAAEDDSVVWFHDYHLALAPEAVREALSDAFLMQFWHIPWPSWEAFQRCPQATELLEGLLANDLFAVHAGRYCGRFYECVEEALDAEVDRDAGVVRYEGGETAVRAFPLGIDAAEFEGLVGTDEAATFWAEFADEYDLTDVSLGVGVDRLDYTKGILERVEALERLWENHPERRGTFTFVQKGTPSRTRIDEYREYGESVRERIDRVNDRFGTDEWQPIVYLESYLPREGLAALYNRADVAVVSPLRDGMNLVAKEYVAAQTDADGVLVLSELAGAAEQLGEDALVVNPNDRASFADAIEAALSMPERTRRRRMEGLRETVFEQDSATWVREQFETVASIEMDDRPARLRTTHGHDEHRTPSVWRRNSEIRERVGSADGLLVLADFDGTLADIVEHPDDAAIEPAAEEALRTLAEDPRTTVGVVSGRALDDLRSRLPVDVDALAGNHGLELDAGEGTLTHPAVDGAADAVETVCETLRERIDVDGVEVENKGPTATVHYRRAPDDEVEDVVETVRETVEDDDLRVADGKQILEIRPAIDWDKGRAVAWLRATLVPDDEDWYVVYVGDDTTDEAAFEAVDDGLTVAVGSGTDSTAAGAVVSDPAEVADLLARLVELPVPAKQASTVEER